MTWFLLTVIVASWMLFWWLADLPMHHIDRYLTHVKDWQTCPQCGIMVPPEQVRKFQVGNEIRRVCPGCCSGMAIMSLLANEVGQEKADKLVDSYIFAMGLLKEH